VTEPVQMDVEVIRSKKDGLRVSGQSQKAVRGERTVRTKWEFHICKVTLFWTSPVGYVEIMWMVTKV